MLYAVEAVQNFCEHKQAKLDQKDSERKEMTLSLIQKQNLGHGGLRSGTLPLDHRGSPPCLYIGAYFLRLSGKETFCFFETWIPEWDNRYEL